MVGDGPILALHEVVQVRYCILLAFVAGIRRGLKAPAEVSGTIAAVCRHTTRSAIKKTGISLKVAREHLTISQTAMVYSLGCTGCTQTFQSVMRESGRKRCFNGASNFSNARNAYVQPCMKGRVRMRVMSFALLSHIQR